MLGRVGWVGAPAQSAAGPGPRSRPTWRRLRAKEFLYRAGKASMAGEREYGFRHVLVCEVAYGQIPRLERADKHRRAAAWLESLAAERSELLAHHYGRALELASAAGQPTDELADRARLALQDAGDRVAGLGAHPTAARYYSQAGHLAEDDPERPDLEVRAGTAYSLGEGAGEDLLTRARDRLLAIGDRARAAEAEAHLGLLAYTQGRDGRPTSTGPMRSPTCPVPLQGARAQPLHDAPAGSRAERRRHAGGPRGAGHGQEPRRPGRRRWTPSAPSAPPGSASATRSGIQDLERCIAICRVDDSSGHLLAEQPRLLPHALLGDLRRSFTVREAGWAAARHFGSARYLRWLELERVAEYYWVRALGPGGPGDRLGRARRRGGRPARYMECLCRLWRGRVPAGQGQLAGAWRTPARPWPGQEVNDRRLDPALAFKARVLLATDQVAEAGKLLDELLATLGRACSSPSSGPTSPSPWSPLAARSRPSTGPCRRWLDAAQAFAASDPARAAKLYAEIGSRPDEATARLARPAGCSPTARPRAGSNRRAMTFFREAGASASLEQAKELLFALT